ncbi:AMP-dependent synthetase [Chryseomicrobium excrementi]|uniref:AMP-dependent synthetase n=1 Tax=Chryseomicrobium excrementi TaxID=2041346 RepID=A0A2M9F0H8_9BACL|nr:AMP-binding protein [Chryseomicrobium excrementi]PJK16964.1 AMP-dependent synthetase [Chryseomicrobium excrementi]
MRSFTNLEPFADQTAIYADRKYSYSELIKSADRIAAAVGRRTLVFCLCKNNLESVAGYVGFVRNGIVAVLLDAEMSPEHLTKLIDLYKPSHIWAKSDHESFNQTMNASFVFGEYTLFEAANPFRYDLHEDLALLLTTSGTTGSPKFVRLSYDNLFSNADSIATYLDIQPDDRPITTLPMNYSYGLSVINSHLVRGAGIVLAEASIIQKEFWELCKEQQVTSIAGVPFVYEMLDRMKFEKMELPSLKQLTQAGGKLQPALTKKFAELCDQRGIRFFTMYGQTEATARMSYVPSNKSLEKAGTIGIAIPGGDLFLEDENGERITEPYVSGELLYNGPNVSLGYAESLEDLLKGDDNKGSLRTGDVAYFDEDGYFTITGRLKRMIKMFGTRISLDELEGLLNKHGHEVVCAGEDDKLFIYTLQDDQDAVKKLMKENLNLRGFAVRKLDAFPRNPYGKILYSELPR